MHLPAHGHLAAFSSLIAADKDASRLTNRDLQVIALIVHQEAMTIGAVANALALSAGYVSRLTDKLVGRGLLRRTEGTDRRIVLLTPTEAGHALDTRVRGHFDQSANAAPPKKTRTPKA